MVAAPGVVGRGMAGALSGTLSFFRPRWRTLLLLLSLVVPATAKAIIFLPLGLALMGGATVELGLSTIASALALGSVVAFVNFKDNTSSTGTAPLHVQLVPDAPLPTPSGWTPPAASGDAGEPSPPGTAAASQTWSFSGHGPYTSFPTACSDYVSYVNGLGGPFCGPSAGTGNCTATVEAGPVCHLYLGNGSSYTSETLNPSSSCPSGYTSDGSGGCNLSDANSVDKPSDGACGIKRVGNTFSADGRDPDCASLPDGLSVGSGYVSVTQPDGTTATVTIDSGTGRATAIVDHPAGNGTTVRETTTFGTGDSSGVPVTGQKTEQFNGTGDQIGGSPVGITSSCGGPGQPPCKIDESGTPDGTGAYSDAGTALDAAATARENQIAGTFTDRVTSLGFVWAPELPEAACEPITFGSSRWHMDWDFCDTLGTVRAMWGWFIVMCCLLYVWRTGTGAVGGGRK